ncbi:MAG TPA: LamG domain-containing protein [Terriglobales bacterium]
MIVLANLSAFYCFLRKLTGSVLIPSTCLLLLPLVIQFRSAWDPILGFCAQYPLLTLLLFCSLILFLKYLDHHDRGALAAATVLFLCCGLIFETSYPMYLLYLAVAYSRLTSRRAAFLASFPFMAVIALLVAISLVLKKLAVAASQVYKPNFSPAQVLKAYGVQSFGAIPFSYYWLDPYRVFSSQITRWPASVIQGLPLLLVLALIAALWVRHDLSFPDGDNVQKARTVDLVWLGGLLFALPQALISLSPKYQALPWGMAYLPVYISRLGLTLLLAIAFYSIYQRTRNVWKKWPALTGVALVVWLVLFAANLQHNWLIANAENETYWYPRVLTEQALRRGLLANAKPGSILLVNGAYSWDNTNEYSGRTGHLYSVYQLNTAADLTPVFTAAGASCQMVARQQECAFAPTAEIYTVQIRHLANGTGAVLLARVNRTYQMNDQVRGLLADELTAYFHLPASIPEPKGSISGRFVQLQQADASPFRIGDDRMGVLRRGRGWELLSFRSGESFDALSLRGEISPEVSESVAPVVKKETAWELRSAGPPLLHIGFERGMLGTGVQQPAITFSNQMSIDLLVSPENQQVPWADILSNHATDYRGIAIEQRGDKTNQYSIAVGSGKEWMYAGDFSLLPARRNYISLQVDGKQTALYVNGALVARTILAAPIASTDRPIYLGNWLGGDRQFNGLIGEVLIAKGTRSSNDVRVDSIRLLDNRSAHSGGN